jgi:hypothetical protein
VSEPKKVEANKRVEEGTEKKKKKLPLMKKTMKV